VNERQNDRGGWWWKEKVGYSNSDSPRLLIPCRRCKRQYQDAFNEDDGEIFTEEQENRIQQYLDEELEDGDADEEQPENVQVRRQFCCDCYMR
jgi:hypothetical protein